MAIDWSHAATGNRVKWAFTSDTSRDDIEMVIAIYRKNARRPYMVIFPIYNTMRGTLNTCNAPVIEGEAAESIKGDYMKGIENVNAFKVTGSPYDNDGMSIYAPVIGAAQQPVEAPQTADNDSTTDNTPAIMKAVENAHRSRYSARQTAPLTFAIWDNVKNAPAIETTSTGIMAYMEIFGIDHIDTETAETIPTTEAEPAPISDTATDTTAPATKTTAHPVPAKLAKEYDARTRTNRDKWQRPRLNGSGSLCNSISWRYYHGAGTPRTVSAG